MNPASRLTRLTTIAILVLAFELLQPAPALAQTWQAAGTLPTAGAPRQYAAGVNAGGVIYAVGGTPWSNGADGDGAVHRLVGGVWTQTAFLDGAGPVVGGAAGYDNLGRIVVYGGFVLGDEENAGQTKTYDPIEGLQGGILSRPEPQSAVGYTAFANDNLGRLYGLGGGLGEGAANSGYCDRYDAVSNAWTVLAAMPTPAADAGAANDGIGHILVIGGINQTGSARLANVARYDIASNTWSDTALPDLPVALSGARAALGIDRRVYVAGGETGPIGAGTTQTAVYKWEPSANTWSAVASMAAPRKHFAFVLADDDYLYAVGGDNNAGGTNAVEKLFTPRCPAFNAQPQDLNAWSGTIAGFSVTLTGATPMTLHWRRNGAVLSNGPTGTGSTLTGADTASLVILSPSDADEASYDCLAENACGSEISASAVLTVRPTPTPATQWTLINLHPAWAESSSYARGVSGGRIGGEAYTPTLLPDGRTLNLAHPVLWSAPSFSDIDLTPSGSVGGGIYDLAGDYLVGWFWHTYPCYAGGQWWTCGWQSAAYWSGDPPVFTEAPHGSGPEYDSVSATDGQRMVGTLTYEYTEGSYSSYAYMWTPPAYGVSLHPGAGVSNSFASAIDGPFQYGTIHTSFPGSVAHAAMWSGTGASFVDLHPAGFSRSSVSGAGDGQAVGSAYIGDSSHALMWVGGPSATIDLTPIGHTASAVDAQGGLQIGSIDGRPTLWAGNAASFVYLDTNLPPEFTGAVADAVDVRPDGTILIAGYGYVPSRNRYEALLWQYDPNAPAFPGDANCDGRLDGLDISAFLVALLNPAAFPSTYAGCNMQNADADSSGQINSDDAAALAVLLLD